VQPQGEVRDLPGCPGGRVPRAGPALAQLRRHHLLDQVGLPVGGGLDRAQVPGLDAVLAKRGHHAGHREGIRPVLPADPADQAVVLQLGQLRLGDARGVEQLAAGHLAGHPAGTGDLGSGLPVPRRGGRTPVTGVLVAGQAFLDHPQRQVRVPLHGEDVPQPLDVGRAEPPVTGPRPGRLDQALGLQEADLGGADVREFRPQLRQHLADAELSAPPELAHGGVPRSPHA
jgi:hypothetical protein